MFSRVEGNKTMKGKYQVLDYRMLWDPSADGWETAYNDNTRPKTCTTPATQRI